MRYYYTRLQQNYVEYIQYSILHITQNKSTLLLCFCFGDAIALKEKANKPEKDCTKRCLHELPVLLDSPLSYKLVTFQIYSKHFLLLLQKNCSWMRSWSFGKKLRDICKHKKSSLRLFSPHIDSQKRTNPTHCQRG